MKLDGLSVFFPCYNEEENLPIVINSALRILPELANDFEIIVVDDGSHDRSPRIVTGIMQDEPRLRLVRHDRNLGYGAALVTGFRAARLPWVFYTDADAQFDLQELGVLIAKSAGADIVSGYRHHRADPRHRLLNAAIFSWSLRIFMGLSVPDVNCAFKLCRREIFDRFPLRTSGALINAEILSRARLAGCKIVWLPVTHQPRVAGMPTGAKPSVILKAIGEFWILFFDLLKTRLQGK
jgi:glycosyltransferase involved in cell wall biosynthesis